MGKDYYKILGIEKTATETEIKKAFREKAHRFHPDKQGGDEAKFKEINEAYQVLGDAKKRSQYDQFGSTFEQAQSQGGFHGFDGFRDFSGFANGFSNGGFNINVEDLGDMFSGFGDMFGFGGGGRKSGSRQGRSLEVAITIDFLEAAFGVEKELRLEKKTKCPDCGGTGVPRSAKVETCRACGGSGRVFTTRRTIFGQMQVQAVCHSCGGEGKIYSEKCHRCSGTGTVNEASTIKIKIPAGIDSGESIRFAGQGEAGEKGAASGDLYIRVKVRPDKRFQREGDNVLSGSSIGFAEAALGAEIEIVTIDGSAKLKIPSGTQSSTTFRLKGRGIQHLKSFGRGDHLVTITVKTPTSLNRKQKELLQELGA